MQVDFPLLLVTLATRSLHANAYILDQPMQVLPSLQRASKFTGTDSAEWQKDALPTLLHYYYDSLVFGQRTCYLKVERADSIEEQGLIAQERHACD